MYTLARVLIALNLEYQAPHSVCSNAAATACCADLSSARYIQDSGEVGKMSGNKRPLF
jgi:hypothetical protein